jgi:hypothetical protein
MKFISNRKEMDSDSSISESDVIEEYVDVPVKNIINASRAEGAIEALNIIQGNLMSYLDDNGIVPEEADPEIRKIVGLVFKSSINIKNECQSMLKETYDFNYELDGIKVKVPKEKVIR